MPDTLKRHEIERFKIDSSVVISAGYQDGICVLEMPNGHLYSYAMPQADFDAFAAAESKGRHFNTIIRKQFSGSKLTSRCGKCGSEPEIVGEPCGDCGAVIVTMDTWHKEER